MPAAAPPILVLSPESPQGRLAGPALKQRLSELRRSGCRGVVVNLEDVRDVDLVAIGWLVEESRCFRRQAGRLVIVEMAEHLREQCARVGALSGLELFSSQEEALGALAGG
ncbi:STAS domain-containing protein [bacterium]|nr:STAS domain-containing protein [bacterium]